MNCVLRADQLAEKTIHTEFVPVRKNFVLLVIKAKNVGAAVIYANAAAVAFVRVYFDWQEISPLFVRLFLMDCAPDFLWG